MTKYTPVTEFLIDQEKNRLHVDFRTVEKILGAPLPKSAHDYQAWWANDASHSQARAWLEAGWQTENLNLAGQTVEFVRVRMPSPAPPVPSPASTDPWGYLAGTVKVTDDAALVAPTGEAWEAEREGV